MKCTNCGKEIDTDSIFCEHCGKAVGSVDGISGSATSKALEKRPKWPFVVGGVAFFLLVAVAVVVIIIIKSVADVEQVAYNNREVVAGEPNKAQSSPETFSSPEVSEVDQWQENFSTILNKCINIDNIVADDTIAIQAAIIAYNGLSLEAQETLYNEKSKLEAALDKANKDAIMRMAKQVAIDYCNLSETSDVKKVYEIFASKVERFHSSYNIDVSEVAKNVSEYDKRFDVIGNKRSSVRWNTFSCQELEDGRVYIEYVEDYSFDRENNSKYSIFVLKKHIVINKNHKIISVYDEQISRAKK